MSATTKPYKIWNADRSLKKSVTASSLKELLEKGSQKLSLADEVDLRVVLEEDGTEVDDDEYFSFLPANTVFVLLCVNESWRPPGVSDDVYKADLVDGENDESCSSVTDLIKTMNRDISQIITFSSEELQLLVNAPTEQLASLLGDHGDPKLANSVQETCQRYLDERREATEAIQLLKLYHHAQLSSQADHDTTHKRKRRK